MTILLDLPIEILKIISFKYDTLSTLKKYNKVIKELNTQINEYNDAVLPSHQQVERMMWGRIHAIEECNLKKHYITGITVYTEHKMNKIMYFFNYYFKIYPHLFRLPTIENGCIQKYYTITYLKEEYKIGDRIYAYDESKKIIVI